MLDDGGVSAVMSVSPFSAIRLLKKNDFNIVPLSIKTGVNALKTSTKCVNKYKLMFIHLHNMYSPPPNMDWVISVKRSSTELSHAAP